MTFEPPERFNIADFLLDARVREGRGARVALVAGGRTWSYRDVQELASRYGHLLREAGVMPEQRVIIALPDGPEFVAALFGILKIGAVVVMVNPDLKPDAIAYFYQYTRARVAVVSAEAQPAFEAARAERRCWASWWWGREATERRLAAQPPELEAFRATATTPASGSSAAAPPATPRRCSRATGALPTPPRATGRASWGSPRTT